MITYARTEDPDSPDANDCLRISEVLTGENKKSFSPPSRSAALNGSNKLIHTWPFIKWSYKEEYFAFSRPGDNRLNVYETREWLPVEPRRPLEIEALASFEWSPTRNRIAYYSEERPGANVPAVIGLMEYPSRAEARALRIFSVSAANLYWQKSGAYLAAHTEVSVDTYI